MAAYRTPPIENDVPVNRGNGVPPLVTDEELEMLTHDPQDAPADTMSMSLDCYLAMCELAQRRTHDREYTKESAYRISDDRLRELISYVDPANVDRDCAFTCYTLYKAYVELVIRRRRQDEERGS